MRALVVILVLMVVLAAGCDPGGLRRVRLRLPEAPDDSGTLVVHQPDVQEALRILDGVVVPLGFKPIPDQPTNTYIRVYMLSQAPIRVSRMQTGIEVSFGEVGFLASTPTPVVRAFEQSRAAFVTRFGRKNVSTKTFGSANPQGGANGRQPIRLETNTTSAAAASRRSP
jgi:hypothetical protein